MSASKQGKNCNKWNIRIEKSNWNWKRELELKIQIWLRLKLYNWLSDSMLVFSIQRMFLLAALPSIRERDFARTWEWLVEFNFFLPRIFSRGNAALHLAVSVGRSVRLSNRRSVTFLNSKRFSLYCSCPTVRDCPAVYPALFFQKAIIKFLFYHSVTWNTL